MEKIKIYTQKWWFLIDILYEEFIKIVKNDTFLYEIWEKYIGKVENKKYQQDIERMWFSEEEKIIKIFQIIDGKLWVPKWNFYLVCAPFLAILAEKFNLKYDFYQKNIKKEWKLFNFNNWFKLYKHQEKIVNTIKNKEIKQIDLIRKYLQKTWLYTENIIRITLKHFPFLAEDVYAWYIISPARSGKTITMLALANELWLKTLILVDKEVIFNQFKERIENFTDLEVALYQWSKSFNKIHKEAKIWIWLIQTIATLFKDTDKEKQEVLRKEFSKYDLILVDEAHNVATKTLMTALSWLSFEKIFGFTATKMRWDGNHILLDYFVGETITEIKQEDVSNMVYDIHIYPLEFHIEESLWFKQVKRTPKWIIEYINKWAVKELYNNPKRNKIILEKIKSAISQDRLILVIWETLDHLNYLKDEINRHYKKDVAYMIDWKTNKKEKEEILKLFEESWKKRAQWKEFIPKVLFATYSLLWKWFDGPYFDTMLLVSPIWAKKKENWADWRATIIQVVNRIWNKVEWKKQPICIDIVDIEPEWVLLNMARSRYWNVYIDKYWDLKHNFVVKWNWREII